MKISVVIPFYQREPGVLLRCLTSIYAQNLPEGVELDVIVVDDESPLEPAGDLLAAGTPPPNVTTRIIHRSNGGPGASRNTGFDEAVGADVIALIDSDDSWNPLHLRRALQGLEAGADAYFSDHRGEDGRHYLPVMDFYLDIKAGRLKVEPGPDGIFFLSGYQTADFSTREYLAHTSTIVFRADRFKGVRMTELLRAAGEDHLFFIDLALRAKKFAISFDWGAELGKGVNIYASAFGWGREVDLRRRAFNLAALKMVRDRAEWTPETRADIGRRVMEGRQVVGYLILRLIATQRKINWDLLKFIWSLDRRTVLLAPFSPIPMMSLRRRKYTAPPEPPPEGLGAAG